MHSSPDAICLASAPVSAGFPSPAQDHAQRRIDLTELLITHPQATFLVRVQGESMREAGVLHDDILVVNRALKPRHGHIVVAVIDGDFTVKRLYQRDGAVRLEAANPEFDDIVPCGDQELQIWGVVTGAVRQFPA